MDPLFFETQVDMRKWFLQHHDKAGELMLGLYKVGSGLPSVTYRQALDEALCFGWIDSVRRSRDSRSYVQRFTPRKKKSAWSRVNIKRVGELTKLGLMHDAGLRVFRNRDKSLQQQYSYEQKDPKLDAARLKELRSNQKAWEFYQAMPRSYTRAVVWWVESAKQETTKAKRLGELIACSSRGLKVPPFRSAEDRQA